MAAPDFNKQPDTQEPTETVVVHQVYVQEIEEPPLSKQEVVRKVVRPADCGSHDPKVVYDILIEIGVTRTAAIQQLGSWKQESGLDQCQQRGDGGIAWGLNSWHPGRRKDMPQDLYEQIKWAIHTEMPRDCRTCYEIFMAGADEWSVRSAIKKSTRWGELGKRWVYADQFASIL